MVNSKKDYQKILGSVQKPVKGEAGKTGTWSSKKPIIDIEKSAAMLSEAERIYFLVKLEKCETHVNFLLKKRLKEVSSENIKINKPLQTRTIGTILKLSQEILEQRKENERKT